MKRRIRYLYLQYLNNFLTLKGFAQHYAMSNMQALRVIQIGKKINKIEATKMH